VIRHDITGAPNVMPWHYFTGKTLDDESGLMYYGGRYYNPKLGRFVTADPTIQHPYDPQDLNRYAYCRNNPVNLVDPSGYGWLKKIAQAFKSNPIQTILAVAEIVVGVMIPGTNPFLIAAGITQLASIGTSQIPSMSGVSQGLGYASMALAIAGAFYTPPAGAGTKVAETLNLGRIDIYPVMSDAGRASGIGDAANNAAKAARLAKLGREVSALATTALAVTTVVATAPFIPEAMLVSAGVGAINGGVGGAITGYAGAVAAGTNPYVGAATGALAGAFMGGAVGAAFPGLGNAPLAQQMFMGFAQSGVGQVAGNFTAGRSAFDHISYGALAGSAVGGPLGAGVEGLILSNGISRPAATAVSGVASGSMETAGYDLQKIFQAGF
jgi:RHS repeat-associated protein